MNYLAFKFLPSESTNDHQTRILIDGRDILLSSEFSDTLGLDPVTLFARKTLTTEGLALIGRCSCGCIGCCGEGVIITRTPVDVRWNWGQETFLFDCDEYDAIVRDAIVDTSWETPERTAERLVSNVDFHQYAIPDDLPFEWASARCHEGKIVLSFRQGRKQKLLEADWHQGQPPENAVIAILAMLERLNANDAS